MEQYGVLKSTIEVLIWIVLGAIGLVLCSAQAQDGSGDGPQYADGNGLVFPADYRSWPFVGAGLGMSYTEEGGTPDESQTFSQVFVNPPAYRHFMETGTWPDQTLFVLEFRRSESQGSINVGGHYATELVQLEAEVKDSRFDDGWAFFMLGAGGTRAAVAMPLPAEAAAPCVACHSEHGAVERTFVQFYPTLLEVAREKGTLNPGFAEE